MNLPNLAPPFAPKNSDGSYLLNCTFYVRNNVSTGATNSLGNPIIDSDTTKVEGWAIYETDRRLLATIGASVEESAIRFWLPPPKVIPANFASFINVECDLDLGDKRSGIFRPVRMSHAFPVPNIIIGAFKGVLK